MHLPPLKKACFLLFIGLLALTLSTSAQQEMPRWLTLEVAGSYGDQEGFAQTPTGGEPGTSDVERPTLDELNMDNEFLPRLRVDGHFEFGTVYGAINLIRLEGSGVLEEPLATRQPFPAGTAFDAELIYDWYQIGYARPFTLSNQIVVTPLVEVAILDFEYSFNTSTDDVQRRYAKPSLRIGVQGVFPLSERFKATASVAAALPFSNTPQIITADALFHAQLTDGSFDVGFFGGFSTLYIDYEDNQTMPNHIRFESSPMVTLGFNVAF